MRTAGMVALAAAGLGFLMCTDAGKKFRSQASTMTQQTLDDLRDRWDAHQMRGMVKHAAEEAPDTLMADAFAEALATG